MKKLFKYSAKNHRTKENLNIHECGQGTYIGVNRIQKLPHDQFDEATESIVIPDSQLGPLINALQSHSRLSKSDGASELASTIYELRYEANDVYYVLMRALDKTIIDKRLDEIRAFDKETVETGRRVDYYDHPISKFDEHCVESDYGYYDIYDIPDQTWVSWLEVVSEKIWGPGDV